MAGVEEAVRELDALRRKADQLEAWMRSLRLDQDVEMIDERPAPSLFRRLRMKGGVYGYGYLKAEPEPLPAGMSREFYDYLRDKFDAICKQIRDAEARLASVQVPS